VSKRSKDLQRKTESFGRPAMILDVDNVIRLLRAMVELESGQSAFARRHGIKRSGLNVILNGKRPVTAAVVKALGLRKVYTPE
jgi:hypothetical protein